MANKPVCQLEKELGEIRISNNERPIRWTLWSHSGKVPPNSTWEKELRKHGTFDSMDGFDKEYSGLTPASRLPLGYDYFVFKEGIRPLWEDPNNVNGGRWQTSVEKFRDTNELDKRWERLVKAVVQNSLIPEYFELITGMTISIRLVQKRGCRDSKITLWTGNSDDAHNAQNMAIGKAMSVKLGVKWFNGYFTNRDLNKPRENGYKEAGVLPKLKIGSGSSSRY